MFSRSRSELVGSLTVAAMLSLGGCKLLKPAIRHPAPGPDEGVIGGLQAAHLGKIVFATSSIPRNADASFALVETIGIDQPLHARAFFTESAHRQVGAKIDCYAGIADSEDWPPTGELVLSATIDGGTEVFLSNTPIGDHYDPDPLWPTRTSLLLTFRKDGRAVAEDDVPLVPDHVTIPQEAKTFGGRLVFALAALADGKHHLALRLDARCNNGEGTVTLATGQLELEVTAARRAALLSHMRMATANLPEDAAQLLPGVAALYTDDKLLHFQILDRAWSVERSYEGTPLRRSVTVYLMLETAGRCRGMGGVITQESMGGGTFGAPVLGGAPYVDKDLAAIDLPCEFARAPR
jgi:hypothetical protein